MIERDAVSSSLAHPDRGAALPTPYEEFKKQEVEQSVGDRFEQQVRRYPHRLAIRTSRHEFTYAALNATANRIAHAILARCGEGPEPVGLLFQHGAPVIAAILGALKAGKIYVPLDPANPRARTDYILADLGARLLVTDTECLPLARELAGNDISLIQAEEIDSHTSTADPGLRLPPDTLANILYTSGSTGQPKGVLQDHRHLMEEARLHIMGFQISAEDRLCLQHSCSFSASVRRIFPALLNGAALFPLDIRSEGVRALPEWLIREEITITGGRHLLQECEDLLTGPGQFPRIRLVSFGSDMVYRDDFEKYRSYFRDDCRMVVNLASTEAGTIARFFLDKQTVISGGVVPVGRPVDGKKVSLLDEEGAEVAAGEAGEMVVQSRILFRGYWRRPDLTQAALRPATDSEDEQVFHTGDLARMLPDGCLLHLGRKDFQVKVRGYRVETAEVEMALREVSAIREVVVTARQDRGAEARLIAYLVPAGGLAPSNSAMRRALAARLPEYMLPSAFVIMDELPRTATGKVDRMALPLPGRARPTLDTPYSPPGTPIEKTLVELWSEVLELDRVGVHDSFFELGGHSLLATQVLSRLRDLFQIDLELPAFFAHPTVAALSRALLEREPRPGWAERVAGLRGRIEAMSAADVRAALQQKRGAGAKGMTVDGE